MTLPRTGGPRMLQQTTQQKQELVSKIQLLEFAINSLKTVEVKKEDGEGINKINESIINTSKHKLKLIEELLRLSGVS